MKADEAVDGDRDARLTHVAARSRDAVRDHVPAGVSKRQADRRDRIRSLAVEPQLVARDESRVRRVEAVLPRGAERDRALLVGDEKRRPVVDLDRRVRVDRRDQRAPRRHVGLAVHEQTGGCRGARRAGARNAVTLFHLKTELTLALA